MRALLALCCLGLCGCGYVGDPLPPALNIPERVREVAVSQVGDRLIVEATPPALTTDGLPVRKLDLVALEFNGQAVAKTPPPEGRVRFEVPAAEWAGQSIAVTVRATANGRTSEASQPVEMRVEAPLTPPRDLRASADPAGVKLTWAGDPRPGMQYRVLRRDANQKDTALVGTAAAAEFVDTGAQPGSTYEYRVRGALGAALSEDAGPVQITVVDRFPPAVPSGLTAIAGVNSIELAWERNVEADLRGYRVYRDGQPLADNVEAPAYSDRQVQSGRKYAYSVASLDQRGNESAPSAPVEITVP